MIDVIKKIRTHLIINSIIFIVLGLFIAIKPALAYEFTVNIVSAYFLIMGFIAIVTGFNEKKYNRGYVGSFALGGLYIVAAILIYTLADQIIKIVPYLLGIIILVVGVSHLVNALSLRTMFPINKMPFYIYSILLIVVALFLLMRPMSSLVTLFQVYGVSLVVIGVMDLGLLMYLKKKIVIK